MKLAKNVQTVQVLKNKEWEMYGKLNEVGTNLNKKISSKLGIPIQS